MKIRTVSGNLVNLLPSDAILKVSAVVACSVQMGLSKGYAGLYTIKKTESSANAVTILPATGETIDGAASVTLTTVNEYKTLAPAEGGWTVVDAYTATPSLASPVLTTPKIADGDAGLTITSANQTHASAIATIPDIGDAADEFVMKDTTQTLTGKTLTSPTLTDSILANPAMVFEIGAHNYNAGTTDWTLSAAELLKMVHKPTNAGGGVNAIIPTTAGKPYVFINATGQALTVKTAAGTGVAITNGKTAIVMADGTNVIALAAQSA